MLSPEEEMGGAETMKKKKDDWMTKAGSEFVIKREPIRVTEGEGKVRRRDCEGGKKVERKNKKG